MLEEGDMHPTGKLFEEKLELPEEWKAEQVWARQAKLRQSE